MNLKLKQQRQVSNGKIPPLNPDQVEDEVNKEQNPSTPLENIPQPSTLVSKQEKNLKRSGQTSGNPSESETQPKIPSFDQEQKRYVCTGCLHNWYHNKPLRVPGTFVKTFGSVHRLRIHATNISI